MTAPDPQQFGSPLNLIYFYLTEGCNLRCRHCWVMPEEGSTQKAGGYLDLGIFESILQQAQALGLTGVKLTGGEPCLHPQIQPMLKIIRQANYRLIVETNGVLLTPELAELLATCNKPLVSVSLDGVDVTTHEWVRRVPGCFQAALNGIKYLVEAGLKPQIIFSIMRRNQDQIEPIVRLAQKLGAGSVKFNFIQPSPRGDLMAKKGEILTVPELVELGRWLEQKLVPSVDIQLMITHPPAFRPLKRMFGPNGDGCNVCGIKGILGVLADGSFALCGIGEHIPELVFGHASRDKLVEVWHDHPMLREIRKGLPEQLGGICRDCLMRHRCLGYCLAQNFYQTQQFWTPYWFCDQAEAAGLFPAVWKRPRPQVDNR